MVKGGPQIKTVARVLNKVGSKAADGESKTVKNHIRGWLDHAADPVCKQLWLIIENDWIKYIVDEYGESENDKPFSPSQNSIGSLPQWFVKGWLASKRDKLPKLKFMHSPLKMKALAKKSNKVYHQIACIVLGEGMSEKIPKNTTPRELTCHWDLQLEKTMFNFDRSTFIEVADNNTLVGAVSGPYLMLLPENPEDFIQVRYQYADDVVVTTPERKGSKNWCIMDWWSEDEAYLHDYKGVKRVLIHEFPEHVFKLKDGPSFGSFQLSKPQQHEVVESQVTDSLVAQEPQQHDFAASEVAHPQTASSQVPSTDMMAKMEKFMSMMEQMQQPPVSLASLPELPPSKSRKRRMIDDLDSVGALGTI